MLKAKDIEEQQENIAIDFAEILDKAKDNILVLKFDIPNNIDNNTQDIIYYLHNKIGLMLRSLLELDDVIEKTEVVRKMSKKYPWHGTSIRKSDHIKMCWFAFINFCYIYQTKQKKFSNQIKQCSRILNIECNIDVADRLKTTKKGLHKFIVERGQLVHEWETQSHHVRNYGTVEFLARMGHKDYKNNEKDHYSDAKFFVGIDILSGLNFMINDFRKNLSNDKKSMVAILDRFNEICKKAREHPERVTLSLSSNKSKN